MKIAYIGLKGLPSKSGTERVAEAIVKRLAGKHTLTVYCDRKYTPAGTRIDGVNLIRLPTIQGKHARSTTLFLLSALHALFLGHYDLIHVHGVDACFVLPLLRLRYKIIATSHGSPSRIRRDKWGPIAKFFLKSSEYPFCRLSNLATSVSFADAEFYKSRYHAKVAYIPNGIDESMPCDEESARAELARYSAAPHDYLLFAAGRIDPSKGCHLVIEAYNRVNPGIPLLIIGDLNQVPSYGETLRKMAANRSIVFIPPIADKKLLYGIIKLCRLFIFPSIAEAMSMMLLEAASLGVPVICSAIADNSIVMKDSSIYFKSGDAQDLAEKLKEAIIQPEEMRALGKKASEMLSKKLAWGKIVRRYDELYETCGQGGSLSDVDSEWMA